MASEIVQQEDKVLKKIAKEVPVGEIGSRKISQIIRRMIKALEAEEDGIALAAPQIGESLRIFVVSHRVFEIMEEEYREQRKIPEPEKEEVEFKDLVFINPEITKTSKKKQLMEEGCLSARWLYGTVERPEKTLVRAYNEEGKVFTLGGSGLLSQVFNHEIDHLNGVMFTDKAKHLQDLPPRI